LQLAADGGLRYGAINAQRHAQRSSRRRFPAARACPPPSPL